MVSNDGDPTFLFRNNKNGTFKEVGSAVHLAYAENGHTRAGMGIDTADINHSNFDSMAVGVLFTINGGPPVLCRNDGGNKNNAIRFILQGTKSNRSGIGTLVRVNLSEKDGLRRWVRSGSSYLSQSELPLTLGIGRRDKIPEMAFHWPSGRVTRVTGCQAVSAKIEGNLSGESTSWPSSDASTGTVCRATLKSKTKPPTSLPTRY